MRIFSILLLGLLGPYVLHPSVGVGALIPDDPFYVSHQWYAGTIGLPDAWSRSTGSSAVTIAILDTGAISTVPDLLGRIASPISSTGSPPFSDATLTASPTLRHGTYVAGTVAMGIDNAQGGAGVGNFTILPITVTNSNGNNATSWISNGIRQAAEAGAKVINISQSTLTYGGLDAAAAYARSLGALTFVAAGNTNSRVDRGNFPNLIFVTGTNRLDELWSNGPGVGSTWGPFVDLAAPADDILVPDPTFPNGYGLADGTSFAAPLAAGVAGLIWSINPNLTPVEVETILFSTAVDLGTPGWDEFFGHGRIDASAATAAAIATIPEPAVAIPLVLVVIWAIARRRARAEIGSGNS